MPLPIERLRLAIVGLAVLLLLAIAGSFFYGRWRLRHAAQDLPARLGIHVQQSTKGFVLSQSNADGRTLFTLRAARAIEFKSGGRVSLRNVKIELYNRQNGPPDTIAGDDFEYDPHDQMVQSRGESHIVLYAPGASMGSDTENQADQPIRVTTHGLIFNRKTGLATCSGEVNFATSNASGRAVGAEFDSKQGRLLLESQVVLTSTLHNQPATVNASRAMYDRDKRQIDLSQPLYSSRTVKGTSTGSAAAATIFLRADNSAERLDARGAVRLVSADGMEIRAPAAQVLLNDNNQLRRANLSGGMVFAEDQPGSETRGHAQQTVIGFDPDGRADRVVLDGEVQLRQFANAGGSGLQRSLAANHLVLNLSQDEGQRMHLLSANAAGNAVFTSVATTTGNAAPQTTTVAAQVLNTTFTAQNQPEQVDGAGQTRLQTVTARGDIDSSTGDTLRIEFAPKEPGMPVKRRPRADKAAAKEGDPLAAQSIRSAVQTGHVVLRQIAKGNIKGAAAPGISTATAARASYAGMGDTLTLTGDPMFREGQIEMAARRIEIERATGDVVLTGAVQATLESGNPDSRSHRLDMSGGLLGGAQPAHIIANRGVLKHDAQKATFSGGARLWQGENSIEAPVIELSQKQQTLVAYGEPPCTACVVSNFIGAPAAPDPKRARSNGLLRSTFRVLSGRMIYSDAERKASFLHHVEVFSASGRVTADEAEIFLSAAGRPAAVGRGAKARQDSAEPSSVEKIIASGDVRLSQPGRVATGARLVYTAADGNLVLTGSEKNPPEVVDRERGTVTGQALTFAARDQAIMVSGSSGHSTTTRTRVQQK